MVDIKKVKAILEALLRRAERGGTRWEQETDTSFISAGADYSIRVHSDVPRGTLKEYGRLRITIEILNASGDVVEAYSPGRSDELTNELARLYEIARRSALRVDETLDKVLKDLTD